MKKTLLTLLLTVTSLGSFAQQTNDLSEEEREAFKVQCQERIDAFQMGLEIIADKRQSTEIKNHYIKTIPGMFLGNGEPWTDYNGGLHNAVKMQVSSLIGGKVEIKDIPLVYVGGLVSREKIDEVLNKGFEFVQMGRALLNEPGFVNRMKMEECARCNCGHSNYCIGRMYTVDMACHKHLKEELPPCLKKEIEKLENK